MEDSGEQICVEQKFFRVKEEKATGPILEARIMMMMMMTKSWNISFNKILIND